MVLFNFKKNNPGWQGFSRKISWKQLKIYYNFLKKLYAIRNILAIRNAIRNNTFTYERQSATVLNFKRQLAI